MDLPRICFIREFANLAKQNYALTQSGFCMRETILLLRINLPQILLDVFELQDGTSRERHDCSLCTRNSLGAHIEIDDCYDRSWLYFDVRISR